MPKRHERRRYSFREAPNSETVVGRRLRQKNVIMKFSSTNGFKFPDFFPTFRSTFDFIGKYWFRGVMVFFLLQIFFNKNLSIQVKMNAVEMEEVAQDASSAKTAPVNARIADRPAAKPVVLKNEKQPLTEKALAGFALASKPTKKAWKPEDFSALSFVLNPTLQERKGVPQHIVDLKNKTCHRYVERFARVAIAEMEKFDIPASIILAQGLLESNAGTSKLCGQTQNHFGIKCKPKCLGCTCKNYRDDDIYDMFRVFDTAWESYREHSVLLSSARYKHLKKYGHKDYKNWAHGLKKAGYATDAKYAEKLIMIIEMLDLYQFDA